MQCEASLTDGNVLVRPFQIGDAQPLYEAVRESILEISRWFPWCHPGYSLADSEGFISRKVTEAQETACNLAITDAQHGTFLGGCSLYNIDRADCLAALSYWVRTSQTRRGIATAAGLLVAQYGLRELGLNRIEIIVATGNTASRRVAEKMGAKQEGILRKRFVVGAEIYNAAMYSLIVE